MTKEEILAEIDDFFRDNYDRSITGDNNHKVLTDMVNLIGTSGADGFSVPKGIAITIENEYEFRVANILSVAGTVVAKGDLIIT